MRNRLLVAVAVVLACGCAAPTAPTAAPLPYSPAVRDSLAALNASHTAYRASEVVGRCLNPDTVVMFATDTRGMWRRLNVVSFRACP